MSAEYTLCEETGLRAIGACPHHGGDACLRQFVPKDGGAEPEYEWRVAWERQDLVRVAPLQPPLTAKWTEDNSEHYETREQAEKYMEWAKGLKPRVSTYRNYRLQRRRVSGWEDVDDH